MTRATYDEARDAVYARTAEGWQLLDLSTWPCQGRDLRTPNAPH